MSSPLNVTRQWRFRPLIFTPGESQPCGPPAFVVFSEWLCRGADLTPCRAPALGRDRIANGSLPPLTIIEHADGLLVPVQLSQSHFGGSQLGFSILGVEQTCAQNF
jgi:hypothetical protein